MDGDILKKNRLFLIFLCGLSACMVAYHAVLWLAMNPAPAERSASGAPAGTDEARAVREFEAKAYPALREEILAVAGYDLPIEVDWPSLAARGWSHIYESAFPKVYFLPLIRALKAYAADARDGTGLRAVLRKIAIRNSGRYFGSTGISYADGVLLVDLQPQANVDEGETERAERILELLKSASIPPSAPDR